MCIAVVLVDPVLDDPEDGKVYGHDHYGDYPRDDADDYTNETAQHPANGAEGSDESQPSSDRVKDKGIGQAICSGGASATELSALNSF